MLLLPRWLSASLRGAPARAFHADVVYSTLNGYYFVRMIDDLMDREHPPAPEVLPALIFFHTEFEAPYRRYFPHRHAFWDAFESASYGAADTASEDAGADVIDSAVFERVSARKISGCKVPIAAVCHRYGHADRLEPWSAFVDVLGCWHQMRNDMFDWIRDLDGGRATYFLSEAARQAPTLSTAEWVLSDGLPWGFAQLDAWMARLLDAAGELGCPPLVAYLERRHAEVTREREALAPGLVAIRNLARAFR
jgi:hypothetical protein